MFPPVFHSAQLSERFGKFKKKKKLRVFWRVRTATFLFVRAEQS
jgi:hypothetical protein